MRRPAVDDLGAAKRAVDSLRKIISENMKTRRALDRTGHAVAAYLLGRVVEGSAAVVSLLEADWVDEAATVLRSVWEATVALRFIDAQPAPDEAAKRYRAFGPVQERKRQQQAQNHPGWSALSQVYAASGAVQRAGSNARVEAACRPRKGLAASRTWSGKTLPAMAADVGMEERYVLEYWYLSNIAHMGAAGYYRHVRRAEEGGPELHKTARRRQRPSCSRWSGW